MLAIWVRHGDGLRAGADERVLTTAAGGRVPVRAGRHVDVDVDVDVNVASLDASSSGVGDGAAGVEEINKVVVGGGGVNGDNRRVNLGPIARRGRGGRDNRLGSDRG